MKSVGAALLLLLVAAPLAESRFNVASPVERVVILLKSLEKSILQDGEIEEQLYNKYTCWVNTVMKLKADAIDEAKTKAKETARNILMLKGTIATLAAEIEELENKIADSVKIQEDEQALRQKENAAYFTETTEMKEAILALQQAITVLTEATTPSLLQTRTAGVNAVRKALEALPAKSSMSLKPKSFAMLTTFMNGGSATAYAPQSVTVQGILRDMYDTFTEDLESATRDEAKANANYEKLIFVQQEAVRGWEADIAGKKEKKAKAEGDLAEATSLYDQLQAQIQADIEYFDEVKANGLNKYDDWTQRKYARDAEVDGIQKALVILSSDEARTLFDTSIKAGKATPTTPSPLALIQLVNDNVDAEATASMHAYNILRDQAKALKSIRLGELAVEVRMAKVGHFDAVIASIDKMIVALQEEDADDIKKRDQCKNEYQSTDASIADLKWKIKVNIATIDDLEEEIAKNRAEKDETIAQIKDVEKQMSEMTSARKVENSEFLQSKKDDEGAIQLLQSATEIFSKYYSENNITLGPIQAGVKDLAMTQQGPDFEISQWQAPEANFNHAGHHKLEAKDIVSILTMLTEDLYDEIRVSQNVETDAQVRYEKAMKAAQQLKEDLIARKITLENMIAADQKLKAEENTKKDNNEAEKKDEATYRANITPDCDWIIGAFTERATKRTAEMEGLAGAKDFLAGAQEAALVQKTKRKNVGFLGVSR